MVKPKKLPSGSWRIRVRNKNGDQSFTAPTKAEVEMLYAQYKANLEKKPSDKTVRECLEEYIKLNSPTLKPKTLESYETILNNAFPHFMDTKISELNKNVVANAILKESQRETSRTHKTLSPKTVTNEWIIIASALKTVADISFNVKLPKKTPKHSRFPEPLEIMEAFRGTNVELPVMLALWCGLRSAEIYGITYGSIHGNKIMIDKTRVTVNGKRVLQYSAKTETSIREVTMPDYVMSLIPPCSEGEDEFLIKEKHSTVYHRYKTICEAHGLDISFHRLRHEFASIQLSKLNVDMKTVQVMGGWKSDYCVRKIYSECFEEQRSEANKRSNQYLESLL